MGTLAADVVVVGGGPAGVAAALFLRQRGHDVLLLDSARFPRDKICGEGVSPEAWRLLHALGVAAHIVELEPQALRGMQLVSPSGTRFLGVYGGGRTGFAVRRTRLDAALLGAAESAGVRVRQGVRASQVILEAGRVVGVEAVEHDETPVTLRARLVIGADGRRSLVARRLGLLREHPRWRKFAVRGYWSAVAGLSSHGEMHVGGGGYCGIAPLSGHEANVTFVLDQDDMGAAGGDLESFYRRTLGRWPEIAERLQGATLLSPPAAIGPLALLARHVSGPGALVVGDAAGFYDPFTGEGVTLALRSAEMAAEVADQALRRSAPDLTAYDRLRHEATRDKFLFNRVLQRIVAWPALADAVATRLRRRPDLADRLVSIAGDFEPARSAFGLRFLYDLVRA